MKKIHIKFSLENKEILEIEEKLKELLSEKFGDFEKIERFGVQKNYSLHLYPRKEYRENDHIDKIVCDIGYDGRRSVLIITAIGGHPDPFYVDTDIKDKLEYVENEMKKLFID
ncbi:MAG: hypothetical protein J7K87_03440 [Candidatus Aenigmarchaeota archaeon]|nr:hypothetical protein [Candidatus Aenigmarchaeota archaeon]